MVSPCLTVATARSLDQDSVAHEHVRRLPDQDLVRLRRLLEALGDVDGLSGDEEVPLRVVAGDHLAGVDADPVGKPDAPDPLQLVVEDGECLAHLDRRPHRPQGVVLVHDRHAEHGHDRVTDVLLDDAAVTLDGVLHRTEVERQQIPMRLRIELPAQPRRVDQVGEEDGDGLAHIWQPASLDRRFRLRGDLRDARLGLDWRAAHAPRDYSAVHASNCVVPIRRVASRMRVSSEGGLGAPLDLGPGELGSSATPKAAKSHAEGSASIGHIRRFGAPCATLPRSIPTPLTVKGARIRVPCWGLARADRPAPSNAFPLRASAVDAVTTKPPRG